MKKKILLVLILLLTIGFAALATTLYINGSTKISVNEDECKNSLMFTKALVDNVNLSSTIISNDGKTITFETKELKSVGDKSTLKYTITNNSNQYGNQASLSLNISSNEYIKVTNNRTDYGLNSGESVDGTLTVELIKGCMKSTEGTCDITFSAEIVGVCTETGAGVEPIVTQPLAKYKLTVDPNGGVYNNTTDISEIEYERESEITLEDPTRENYIFMGWESDSLNYNNGVVIMNSDVTVRAKWVASDSVVARIVETGEIYSTLQAAFDAVQTNQTIELLKDITEVSTNSKKCTLDMNHFTINGTVNNTGDLTVLNGTINSTNTNSGENNGLSNKLKKYNKDILLQPFNNEPAIVDLTETETLPAIQNKGKLTLGIDDGVVNSKNCNPNVDDGCVILIGHQGIKQEGSLNFYDGYISADYGIVGGCDKTPDYRLTEDGITITYKPFVDKGVDFLQLVYLTNPDKAVSKTNVNGEVYYYNLQDNINMSEVTGYDISIIRDFDATYTLTVHDGKKVNIDLSGFNINTGYSITNNGELNINNSLDTGGINASLSIENNGTLKINDTNMIATTDNDLVNNNGRIIVNNSTLTGKNSYAIKNNETGTFDISNDSNITSISKYGLYNKATATISNGTFNGIYNDGNITFENANVSNVGEYSIYNNGTMTVNDINVGGSRIGLYNKGTLTVNGGTLTPTSHAIYSLSSNGLTTINNGTFTSTGNDSAVYIQESSVVVKDGTFTGYHGLNLYYATATVDGGTYRGSVSGIRPYNSDLTINDGDIYGNSYGLKLEWWSKTTVNGGNIKGGSDGINIDHSEFLKIYGGSIIGETRYGVYGNSPVYFGVNDGVVSTESPYIKGETYGFYDVNNNSYVYDGVFIGKTYGYNSFNSILDAYHFKEETDGEYYVNTLEADKMFCQVGDVQFNSLQNAINSIESTGTIKLIDDNSVNTSVTFPSGKNITLDLNNHEYAITNTIHNNGTLTITDTSDEKKGKIKTLTTGYQKHTIYNEGTITVENGQVYCPSDNYSHAIYNQNGTVTVNGGTLYGESVALGGYGYMTINGGYLYGKSNTLEPTSNWYGNMTINGGEIESPGNCIYNGGLTTIVNDGNFECGNILDNVGATYIKGGTLHAKSTAYIAGNGELYYSGGTTTSDGNGVYGNWYGYFDISGGSIVAENYGVYINEMRHAGKITGGTIEGKNQDGLFINWASDPIEIGTNDTTVSTESPVIKGKNYGINSTNGTSLNIFDGIFIGETKGHTINNIRTLADGYVLFEDEQDNLKRTYLKAKANICKVGDVEFNSVQKAIDSIETEGTIEFIANGENQADLTIPTGKNITMDLAGFTLSTTKKLTNSGTLTVKDSTYDKEGTILGTNGDQNFELIRNDGTMTIESGNLRSPNGGTYTIESYGNIIMNGGYVQGASSAVEVYRGSGTFNGGKIKSYTRTLSILYADVVVNNLEVEANDLAVYISSSDSSVTIEDINITAGNGISFGYGNTNIINNATINATNNGIICEGENGVINNAIVNAGDNAIYVGRWGSVTVNGGTFTGQSNGMYVDADWRKAPQINSGTITGVNGYGIYTQNPLNIGTNDGTIKDDIVISGGTYGIYTYDNNVPVYYYDGIINYKVGLINREFKSIATNSQIVTTEENDVFTSKLEVEDDVIRNNTLNKSFININDALGEASDGDQLEMVKDTYIYYTVNINKNITLDLKGYDLNLSVGMINSSTSTIENTSSNESIIKTLFPINLIKNDGTLTINNIKFNTTNVEVSNITNYGTLSIKDSTITGYQGIYNEGSLELDNVTINASKNGIDNRNIFDIKDSNIKGKQYAIYSNSTADSKITNTKLSEGSGSDLNSIYSIYNNNTGKIDSDTGSYDGLIHNNGTLNLDSDVITRQLYNSGTATIKDSNLNLNLDSVANYGNQKMIHNDGTMELNNTNININKTGYNYRELYILANYGTLDIYDSKATYNNLSEQNDGTNYGLYNTSIANIHNYDVTVGTCENAFGIRNTGENAVSNIKDANIKLTAYNAYGIYIDTGTVIMGEYDGIGDETSNVSITNPYIEAIGTNKGIALTKNNGLFKFYDGKLVGSTDTLTETPTETEYHYEAITTTDETTGYKVCTLVYIK